MARKDKNFTTLNMLVLCLIVVFVIFIAINFIFKPFDRQSPLIGDRVCGSLDDSLKNSCCADVHADDSVIACLGEWRYSDKCTFVCFSKAELNERNCVAGGGAWREFGNGCVDSCEAARNPMTGCTQSLTFGCDCENGCWNGESCEDN